jgi:hypothetical protein
MHRIACPGPSLRCGILGLRRWLASRSDVGDRGVDQASAQDSTPWHSWHSAWLCKPVLGKQLSVQRFGLAASCQPKLTVDKNNSAQSAKYELLLEDDTCIKIREREKGKLPVNSRFEYQGYIRPSWPYITGD